MVRMPLKLRSSKFRHIYGAPPRKEHCYENVKITKSAHDANFCCVNPKFLAVVLEGIGGGSFVVLPIKKVGRLDQNIPKVCGHAGPVTEIKWNPFDDHVIASGSEDCTIKLWEVPEVGLVTNVTRWLVELVGHGRRVDYMEWHPTAENILASTGYDFMCFVWNAGTGEALQRIDCHSGTIFSMQWNWDGSLLGTTCKDKKLRIIDPRTAQVHQEVKCQSSIKSWKMTFCGNKRRVITTGFDMGTRQICLWDVDSLADGPIAEQMVDNSSGTLFLFYDPDNHIVYLAGKGDGNIRYYEVVDHSPYLCYLDQHGSSDPQRGLGFMPKRGLDLKRCEIARFYKLHSTKPLIEPIPMIVPRRSSVFQEDIYPPTSSCAPALSAEEWISGVDRDPILVSMKLYYKLLSIHPDTIMDLKETSGSKNGSGESSRRGSLRELADKKRQAARIVSAPTAPDTSAVQHIDDNLPASLKNIHKLSAGGGETIPPLGPSQMAGPGAKSVEQADGGADSSADKLLSGAVGSGSQPLQVDVPSTAPGLDEAAAQHQEPVRMRPKRSPEAPPTVKAGASLDSHAHSIPATHSPRGSRNYTVAPGDDPVLDLASDRGGQDGSQSKPARWRDNKIWQQPAGAVNGQQSTNAGEEGERSKGSDQNSVLVSKAGVSLRAPVRQKHGGRLAGRRPVSFSAATAPTLRREADTTAHPSPVSENGRVLSMAAMSTDELHRAYFRQVEEMKSLRQQVTMKDKRIQQLEEEVANLQVCLHKVQSAGSTPATPSATTT